MLRLRSGTLPAEIQPFPNHPHLGSGEFSFFDSIFFSGSLFFFSCMCFVVVGGGESDFFFVETCWVRLLLDLYLI